jgi:trans-aconitate methyltransferase
MESYGMPSNDWNAALYDQKHAFVFEYGKGLLAVLEPKAGESILDLGCGTGHLAQEMADAGARVVGIDSSPEMVEKARKTYPEVEFLVADARDFSFPYQFDAVFSNATLHWIPEAERVVERISTALRPGGRFVAEFGGRGNVASIVGALREATRELTGVAVEAGWYYPSIGEYAPLLEKHGLAVQSAVLFDRPTKLEDGEKGIRNWINMFCQDMLHPVPVDMRPQVIERIEAILRPKLFKDGNWFGDYRRLRIVAFKA